MTWFWVHRYAGLAMAFFLVVAGSPAACSPSTTSSAHKLFGAELNGMLDDPVTEGAPQEANHDYSFRVGGLDG